MKKISTILIVAMISLVSALKANAQYNGGPDWLGEWCTIHVNLTTDPTDRQWATYSFPHPPEFLGPVYYYVDDYTPYLRGDDTILECSGPGGPYITTNGGDPELHLNLLFLKDEIEINDIDWVANPVYEVFVDFSVQKTARDLYGGIHQCFYTLRISVTKGN